MRHTASALTADERERLENLVKKHGLAGAARIVGMSRHTLSSCLLGTAREGSILTLRTHFTAATG